MTARKGLSRLLTKEVQLHLLIIIWFCVSLTATGAIYVNEYPKQDVSPPSLEPKPLLADHDESEKEINESATASRKEEMNMSSPSVQRGQSKIQKNMEEWKPAFVRNRDRYPAKLEWRFREMGLRASIPSKSKKSNVLRLYLSKDLSTPEDFNCVYDCIYNELLNLKFTEVYLYRLEKSNTSTFLSKKLVNPKPQSA